jgi:hypothetical protein
VAFNGHTKTNNQKGVKMTSKKTLQIIQHELKAPKGQENKFGGYKYRSCEDIMEAVKPLLDKNNVILTVSDDVVVIGDRFYLKAIATLLDSESGEILAQTTAFAREPVAKKGMDESQITGAASSYARKYALNGLFCIDDTKDADTMDNRDDSKRIATMKDRIKALLDDIDPTVDTSAYAKYKDSESIDELTAIGIAVKKLHDTQGAK